MKNVLMSETGNSQPRLTSASVESRGPHVRLMANLQAGTLATGEFEGGDAHARSLRKPTEQRALEGALGWDVGANGL